MSVPVPDKAHSSKSTYEVRVIQVEREAEDIASFELVDPEGSELPPFSAGAHVHVYLPGDITRQYSLCNDPAERHRYQIAVLNEKNSRGGSRAMHETVKAGGLIAISGPENHFPLAGREANYHLLLAGGIGVTPMMAMLAELQQRGTDFLMHYCTRSSERTAFLKRLAPLIDAGKVILHHDEGDPAKGLNIASALAEFWPGMHLYACGPSGFMNAVNASVSAWPTHCVHQEYFTEREMTEEQKAWDSKAFRVRLANTGAMIDVPAGCSIAQALRDHGIQVETDCEEGYCGTCLTQFIEGEPVHRDTVLDESGRKDYVMICCARAKSDELVIDL